ncbi:MAG: YdcF family protein, partial [Bellilinea sp.]
MDMFVFLSKFLPLLVYPLGLACIFIILALVLSKHLRMRYAALWVALLVLWIGGNRWVSSSLTRSLETRYLAPETIPAVEAIVVLGGGTESSGPPRSGVEINGAGDRL